MFGITIPIYVPIYLYTIFLDCKSSNSIASGVSLCGFVWKKGMPFSITVLRCFKRKTDDVYRIFTETNLLKCYPHDAIEELQYDWIAAKLCCDENHCGCMKTPHGMVLSWVVPSCSVQRKIHGFPFGNLSTDSIFSRPTLDAISFA